MVTHITVTHVTFCPGVISPLCTCNRRNVTWPLEYGNTFIFSPLSKFLGKNITGTPCNLHLSEFLSPVPHVQF